jgi:hypothetical protein
MPHWAWVALLFLGIIALFAFILYVGGGEPIDRQDSGAGDAPFDGHGHGHGDGHH